jgi:hypothetical protein
MKLSLDSPAVRLVILALAGGVTWWFLTISDLGLILFALLGFLAGASGIKPLWAALALSSVPLGRLIYGAVLHPHMGPTASVVLPVLIIAIAVLTTLPAFVGSLVRRKLVSRRLARMAVVLSLLAFLPREASAQTYYYEHGYTVAFPTIYYNDGSISHHTWLYDYQGNHVGSGQMWYHPWYGNGWWMIWSIHTYPYLGDQSPELYQSWHPHEVSIGLYFVWRASLVEAIFGPLTNGCTAFLDPPIKPCCDRHDIDYGYGGDRSYRATLDQELKECVRWRLNQAYTLGGDAGAYLIWTAVRRFGCGQFTWTGRNPNTGAVDCTKDCGFFCSQPCPIADCINN